MGEDTGGEGRAACVTRPLVVWYNLPDMDTDAQTGKDLVAKMLQDKEFIKGVERGLKDIEEGRYSTLEEVKKRLGDL